MGDWKEFNLFELTEPVKDTYNPIKTDNYKYIGLEHIGQGSLKLNSIGNSNDISSNKFIFKNNDILFGKLRPYFRKVIKVNFSGICSTDIWVFRAKEGVDQSFLFYFLADWNFINLANGGESGSRMPRADWNFLMSTKWFLPPLPEQRAIASVLSSLDDKIDLLNRQNKTLEAMAEALFRQWFVEEVDEGWEEKVITELFEIRDGTHDSPKPKESGKTLITSKHIQGNKLDIENAYLISEDDFEEINRRSKVATNDILFSMIGTIGLLYIEQSNEINYAIKNIGLFKTSQNQDWVYYTYLWLKSSLGQDFIHEQRSGSTQEYIALGSLRSIVFIAPPISLLNKFNSIVKPLFDKRKNNCKQICKLEELRDSLLPKLMSGEVRVRNE